VRAHLRTATSAELSREVQALGLFGVLDELGMCWQVGSVAISATFTVLQGQVSNLGWMFREDTYLDASTPAVRVLGCTHTFRGRVVPDRGFSWDGCM
jgi:hypothetical protein